MKNDYEKLEAKQAMGRARIVGVLVFVILVVSVLFALFWACPQ